MHWKTALLLKWNLTLFSVTCFLLNFAFVTSTRKTYIIQMDNSAMPMVFSNHIDWYTSKINSILEEQNTSSNTESRIIYNYKNAFHGLAAHLTEEEASRLGQHHGVVALFPETMYHLHTTRSPMFLGLDKKEVIIDEARNKAHSHSRNHDVIVGVLDTGIWPESPSFNDSGLGPVPKRWKGECEKGRAFDPARHCNNKIVGARVFYHGYEAATGKINEDMEYKSPRDQDGHGTHTAGTVCGSPVPGASLLGYAPGTARGMHPRARIAAYKVCWTGGCFSSDILSAVDQAVSDGVDVLSVSLGGGVSSYFRDSLSVATFGAMEKGVFVSCSAGNGGPDPISLTNVAPWVATVGASTLDRNFPASVKVGNGKSFNGVSIYKGKMNLSAEKLYPVVYLGSNSTIPDPNALCLEGTLDRRKVRGKIVICDRGINPRVQKGQIVKEAGGIGMILANTAANGEELVADCHLLPAVAVGEKEGNIIKNYAMTNPKNATATLSFLGTKLGIKPSPVVAAFSSRGPNILSLEVLKPDMVAPGVNILAAWSGSVGPSGVSADHRRVQFNVLSGTSMSCPHVSGVAALIKARHPTWSPAAIKSALMTTAYVHDNSNRPLTDAATDSPSSLYDHGAGHINPVRALDPGLVYDISPQDYFDFLCTQNPTPMQLKVFSKGKMVCHKTISKAGDLNYPALSAMFPSNASISSITLHRTVTNVGKPISSYRAKVTPLKGAKVVVEPKVLNFTKMYQKLSYKVTFKTVSRQPRPRAGYLVWKDGAHKVRSPVVLTWLPPM